MQKAVSNFPPKMTNISDDEWKKRPFFTPTVKVNKEEDVLCVRACAFSFRFSIYHNHIEVKCSFYMGGGANCAMFCTLIGQKLFMN